MQTNETTIYINRAPDSEVNGGTELGRGTSAGTNCIAQATAFYTAIHKASAGAVFFNSSDMKCLGQEHGPCDHYATSVPVRGCQTDAEVEAYQTSALDALADDMADAGGKWGNQ